MTSEPRVIVITGPTGSGKTSLAVALAKQLNTEIISADSRQIYKGIPIVTAVPSMEERESIPHHLMETLPLDAYYSAAMFREDAINILEDIFRNHDTAIVCGGSMLYIDALTKGIDELPTVPDSIRKPLMREWSDKGDDWLLQQLAALDPDYYRKVDLKNLKRVFHAVEVSITAGKSYSSLLTGINNSGKLPYKIDIFCMNGNRESLFERINSRVIRMIEAGLEEEARSVYHLRHLNSLNTVGLKEMFAYFDGTLDRSIAIARIQKNTRVYAKKQLTWFKRDPEITYLDFDASLPSLLSQIQK